MNHRGSKAHLGSLEKQIQQIVLSKDFLQNIDIDLKQLNMIKGGAGAVLEPYEE